MFRVIWMLLLVISSAAGAYFSRQYNITKHLYALMAIISNGIFGIYLWAVIAKRSVNLVFDTSLYDLTLSLVWMLTFVLMGCASNFSPINWLGAVVIMIGLVLLKM